MKINDIDKSSLILKGIKYDFTEDLNIVLSALHIVGNSIHRRKLLGDDIIIYLRNIEIFLNQGFSDNDPDIIEARDIFNKLQNIKNQL
jgi:hypothetical protein